MGLSVPTNELHQCGIPPARVMLVMGWWPGPVRCCSRCGWLDPTPTYYPPVLEQELEGRRIRSGD